MRFVGKRFVIACVSLSMIMQSLAPATNALAATLTAENQSNVQLYSDEDQATAEGSVEGTDDVSESQGDSASSSNTPESDAAESATDSSDETTEDGQAESTDSDNASDNAAEQAAEDEVEVSTQASYTYDTLDKLKKAIASGTSACADITLDGAGNIASVAAKDNGDQKVLFALSNTAPELYKNAQVTLKSTGAPVDLTGTVPMGTTALSFNGFGGSDKDTAFAGSIKGSDGAIRSMKVNRSLFNGLQAGNDTHYSIQWAAEGSQSAVLADNLYGADGASVAVDVVGFTPDTSTANPLTAPIVAKSAGDVSFNATIDSSITSAKISYESNVGILVGEVASGTLTVGSLDLGGISSVSVEATGTPSGQDKLNAGFLIGRVAPGAGMVLNANVTAPSGTITVPSGSSNDPGAGGLIGKTGEGNGGSTVALEINAAVDLSALTLKGTVVGGFVGRSGNLKLSFGDVGKVTPAKIGTASNAAGALFAQVQAADDISIDTQHFVLDGVDGYTYEGVYVGGLIGVLGPSSGKITISGPSDRHLTVKSRLTGKGSANGRGVGGLIGSYSWDGSTITKVDVSNVDIDLTVTGGNVAGGAVGWFWGPGVLKLDSVSVVATLNADGYGNASGVWFGGAVGYTRDNKNYTCIVEASDIKVKTFGGALSKGGGIAGMVKGKSVVKMSGKTDLSEVVYNADSANAGQIIGEQDCGLIFATGTGSDEGWTLIRGKAKTGDLELDDISNYGEVIRLTGENGKLAKDFISIDEDNAKVTFADGNKTGLSVASVSDFARLSIAWQTENRFSSINEKTYVDKPITLSSDINLEGTGIIGLTREGITAGDGYTGSFTGSIDGGNHTITLAIGEAYGTWDGQTKVGGSDVGNGRIYRHQRVGLFSSGNGSASKLVINGVINAKAKTDGMEIGAFGGRCDASSDVSFDKVKLCPTIKVEQDNDKTLYLGGAFGQVLTNKTIEFKGGTSFESKINMSSVLKVQTYIGGAIGYVNEANSVTVKATDAKLGGTIVAKTNNDKLYAAGFIGFIGQGSATKAVDITKLDLAGLNLDFSASGPGSAVGGLLGSVWAQTNVSIEGTDAAYALSSSTSASLNTGNAQYVGGLVYHAGGVWTVGNKAIDFNNITIDSKAADLGLIICRGGQGDETGAYGNRKVTSAYLNVAKYWKDSVNFGGISLTGSEPEVMDEWVADTRGYTSSSAGDIFASGVNGVVSLTTGNGTVNMDETGDRNTYENQTKWGKNHPTNGCSRYYYNLDAIAKKVAADTSDNDYNIDTPEEFLLWSVRHYADSSLKDQFNVGDAWREQITGKLDMKGLSYYPVDVANTDVSINNATITFYNAQIESLEKKGTQNKLTSADTQHAAMHCGIFRNYSSSGDNGGKTLTVSGTSLGGTVGSLNGNSGALIFGTVWGESAASTTVNLQEVTLNNLAVTDFNQNVTTYSPLLVNGGASYFSLSLDGLTCNGYTSGGENVVASSLMGNMGGVNATGLNLSFSNIEIPSYGSEKIFLAASLLESFGYSTTGTGSASYNFRKTDTRVTYGQEIDGTKEYGSNNNTGDDAQCWYYDSDHADENLVKDDAHNVTASNDKASPNFGKDGSLYLKYVAYGKDDKKSWQHEIAVNHTVIQVIEGCGTYGDPYIIKSSKNLRDVASILTGSNASGSQVSLILNQEDLCTGSNGKHAVFTSNGVSWSSSSSSVSTTTVRRYLQSAYYKIEGTVEVENFSGLGTNETWAFRGVIVGADADATIKLSRNDGNAVSLIPYSYGSVVKDVNVEYSGEPGVVKYEEPEYMVPRSSFGGVIGCILGGDNIIDGVEVSATNGFTVSGGPSTLKGTNGKLVPVGGYVGVIAGGGVIFRNSNGRNGALENWHPARSTASGTTYAYDNPYLGRMLDGYAFSEGCTVDNGDRNYKINKIDPSQTGGLTASVQMDDSLKELVGTSGIKRPMTVNISTNQDLLVLSAIINSGAAAGATTQSDKHGTLAYYGATDTKEDGYSFGNAGYGKVRNSNYSTVGNASEDDENWKLSKNDDLKAPGLEAAKSASIDTISDIAEQTNASYLVTRYANKMTAFLSYPNICYVEYNFEPVTYNMTSYGSGYLGLSGRYTTNASKGSITTNKTLAVNPLVGSIKGNGATLKVKVDSQEYVDDDFHLLGVGGLFSVANFQSAVNHSGSNQNADENSYQIISDLTISESHISLSYFDGGSLNSVKFDPNTASNGTDQRLKSIVGVGGIAGILAPYGGSSYRGGQIVSFQSNGVTIQSPSAAGSIFGQAGYANLDTGTLVYDAANKSDGIHYFAKAGAGTDLAGMTVRLKDCNYSNLTIDADRDAGGFFGFLVTKKNSESGYWASSDISLGESSTITSKGTYLQMGWGQGETYAGGLVAHMKYTFNVNKKSWGDHGRLTVDGVSVINKNTTSYATGGLIAHVESMTNCNYEDISVASKTKLKGKGYVGGLIGRVPSAEGDISISDVDIDGVTFDNVSDSCGGMIGGFLTYKSVNMTDSSVNNIVFVAQNSGAAIGNLGSNGGKLYIKDSRIENNEMGGKSSGALVGYDVGLIAGSNVLISNVRYSNKTNQGLIAGSLWKPDSGSYKGIRLAGVDFRLGSEQTNADLPADIAQNAPDDFMAQSYVAYADYNDVADTNRVTESESPFDASASDPYATTSPKSSLSVSDGSEVKSLFGDSMLPSTATTIQSEKGSTSETGKYRYTNAPDADFTNAISTMSANNASAQIAQANDFGVLQVSSGNEDLIDKYLDTVTNGGYSNAKALGLVKAAAKSYGYSNDGNMTLTAYNGSTKQALSVTGSGTSSLGYTVTSGYDNELMRVTLLTVKIAADSDASKGEYVLYVPIIVRRMLEVDFAATFVNGTAFSDSSYKDSNGNYLGANAHVLESYGNSMTGLLTYTYNSAHGDATEYGWNTYLDDGGSMGPTQKDLVFVSSGGDYGNYPVGTQLTLVDCSQNNKEYHYMVKGQSISRVSLSEFKDANGNAYEPRWLSDLMGTTASKEDDGKWVEEADTLKATAMATFKGKAMYFRPKTDDDAGKDTYKLTVATTGEGSDKKEISPSENFYLVARFPENNDASAAAINGALQTRLNLAVATRVNQVLRTDGKTTDPLSDSASTYSILTGYEQSLKDNDGITSKTIPEATVNGHTISLNVTDTVTFAQSQPYTGDDQLYYQLNAALGQWSKSNGSDSLDSAIGFPGNGTTSGTVVFYVRAGDSYYTWNGKSWEDAGSTETPSGLSYDWSGDGDEMKLLLGSSSDNAVSLAQVRDAAKSAGVGSFDITARMTINMTDEAYATAIAASAKSGEDYWTKLVYRGSLAANSAALAYSNMTTKIDGNHGYYRNDDPFTTISLEASIPSQLGINIDDLRQETANGTIGTSATYDLSKASNATQLLSQAASVKFTATLQQRADTGGKYDPVDIAEFMSSVSSNKATTNEGKSSYSWTLARGNDGTFGGTLVQNGQDIKFVLPINFTVDTKKDAHTYANYRIFMTATLYDSSGNVINTPGNASDFITYTLTRVNLQGIS